MSSRFLIALKVTGTSALKVVGILVTLKATVDRNVNSLCSQDFDGSKSNGQQECQLPLLAGFCNSEKLRFQFRLLTGSSVFQVFGSSESYRKDSS